MWSKEEGFKDLLKTWWEGFNIRGSYSFILIEKLKALKANLKRWNKKVSGNVTVNKELALNQVVFWDAEEGTRVLSLEEQFARLHD